MLPKSHAQLFGVSHETFEIYESCLRKWQKAINLVSPSTLNHIHERHIADSAQLVEHIPNNIKAIADLGSGAGFPGAILSLMRPDLEVHLVESDERKCQFLRTVLRETGGKATVHNDRIENMYERISPSFVTARALSSLDQLLSFCLPWSQTNPDLIMAFLKGHKYLEEIEEAQKKYNFEYEVYASKTNPDGAVIIIRNLVA